MLTRVIPTGQIITGQICPAGQFPSDKELHLADLTMQFVWQNCSRWKSGGGGWGDGGCKLLRTAFVAVSLTVISVILRVAIKQKQLNFFSVTSLWRSYSAEEYTAECALDILWIYYVFVWYNETRENEMYIKYMCALYLWIDLHVSLYVCTLWDCVCVRTVCICSYCFVCVLFVLCICLSVCLWILANCHLFLFLFLLQVLLAAYERDLRFKPRLVSLFHGQHMEPWYVKLNPEGTHVPVLVHGDTVINDPEEIINYIDTLGSGKTKTKIMYCHECLRYCLPLSMIMIFKTSKHIKGYKEHYSLK